VKARLGEPYGVVVVVLEVVVLVDCVVVLGSVIGAVVLVAVIVVVVVVDDGFFTDGTQSSRRWISVTSSAPNCVAIDAGIVPKRTVERVL
jgi:hypothetical protein